MGAVKSVRGVGGGMYNFSRPADMNDYKYSKTASMLDKLVHVIRIFGVFTAIGKILLYNVQNTKLI